MCGTICSNDATLSRGTTITVPLSVFGSMRPISFVSATIDVYSVPCAPETNATTRPRLGAVDDRHLDRRAGIGAGWDHEHAIGALTPRVRSPSRR